MRTFARALTAVLGSTGMVATVLLATQAPAQAMSCSKPQPHYEVCTGIRHEVLASKFEDGTAQYDTSVPDLYVNGRLTDQSADGQCAWMRALVTGVYWPDGNAYTEPSWKVCGAGKSKTIGINLDQAFTYPNNLIQIQHCFPSSGQRFCATVFERRIPG